jgi:hypothetical protein
MTITAVSTWAPNGSGDHPRGRGPQVDPRDNEPPYNEPPESR